MTEEDARSLRALAAIAKRGAPALTANVLSSIGNLALSIAITRSAPIEEVGIFALSFAIYLLLKGFIQASITDSVITHIGDHQLNQRACRRVSFVGLIATAATIIVGLLSGVSYVSTLGYCLHGLLIYDYTRSINITVGRPWVAALQDTIWTAATIPLAALAFTGSATPLFAFSGWCLSGALVGYLSAWQQSYEIAPTWRYRLDDTRAFVLFGFSFAVSSGFAQITPALLTAVAGLAVVGALRGGSTVLGPAGIITGTFQLLLLPSISRAKHLPTKTVLARSLRMTVLGLCVITPLLTTTYLLARAFGESIFKQNWSYISPLLVALSIESLFVALAAVPYAGLRAIGAGRQTLILRTTVGATRLILVVSLGAWMGASGSAAGMAFVAGLSTVAAWFSYSAALRPGSTR